MFQLGPSQVSFLHHSAPHSSIFQRFGVSSSASPEPTDKEQGSTVENNGASTNAEPTNMSGDANLSNQATDQMKESGPISESQSTMSESVKRRRKGTKRIAFSDSDSESEGEGELSMDDLAKLVVEKEELLKLKHKEIEKLQDKVVRSYAELENVVDRTRRDAENSKKFAIQVSI
jgi:molecular chaperone GrpE